MIVTYIRSSSVGTHDVCPHKYFLSYVLSIKEPPSEKASYGNVIHKGFEVISRRQLAIQNGLDYVDCEELGTYPINEVTDDFALRLGFNHYRDIEMPHWEEKKFEEAKDDFHKALNFAGGIFDPKNMNLVDVEKRFDITMEQDWARYDYVLPDGTRIQGQLTLKGTIDCIYRDHNGNLICLDYKTGMNMKDMKTELEKDFDYFMEDFQINLYIYALYKLYPDESHITFTIWYMRTHGPYTLCIEKNDIPYIEDMIRDRFESIRDTRVPKLKPFNWFCKYVCGHYKNKIGNKTVCQHYREEIQCKGIDVVTLENADLSKISTYQDGGGRKAK